MAPPAYFVNRRVELALFQDLLDRRRSERLLLIFDRGGKGKTTLLGEMRRQARQQRCLCASLEFGPTPLDYLALCREIRDSLGEEYFPAFRLKETDWLSYEIKIRLLADGRPSGAARGSVRVGDVAPTGSAAVNIASGDIVQVSNLQVDHLALELGSDAWRLGQIQSQMVYELSKAFLSDLTGLDTPAVLFLDAFEKCSPDLLAWLEKWVLRPAGDGRVEHLLVVAAGRREAAHTHNLSRGWEELACVVDGLSEFAFEDVQTYFRSRRNLALLDEHILAYYNIVKADPYLMGQIGDRLERPF